MGEMITTKKSQDFSTYSCEKFVEVLASKAPVPGGGSVTTSVLIQHVVMATMKKYI